MTGSTAERNEHGAERLRLPVLLGGPAHGKVLPTPGVNSLRVPVQYPFDKSLWVEPDITLHPGAREATYLRQEIGFSGSSMRVEAFVYDQVRDVDAGFAIWGEMVRVCREHGWR